MLNEKIVMITLTVLVGIGGITGVSVMIKNKSDTPKIEQKVNPIQDDRIEPNKEQETFKYAKNTLVFKEVGDVFLYDTESGDLKDVRNMGAILKSPIEKPVFKKMDVWGTRVVLKEVNSNQLVLLEANDNAISANPIELGIGEGTKINFAYLDDSYVYAVQGQVVYKSNYLNQEEVVKTTLKKSPDTFVVTEDAYIYSNENKLLKQSKNGGEATEIVLGDKTRQTVFEDGKIYVMNSFGEGNKNSVLMKINPEDMKVDQILEVSGTTVKILGFNEAGTEIMVQVNNIVNSYETEGLKAVQTKEIKAEQGAQQFGEAIYSLEDGIVKLISVVDGSEIKEFKAETGQLAIISPIVVVEEQPLEVETPVEVEVKEGGENNGSN